MRDINPSSIFLVTPSRPLSIPIPFPLSSTCSRKLHRAQKIFILCRFRVLSKPSLMNTPSIKNWWSEAGRIVKRIPDVLDNVTVRSRVHRHVRFASTFVYTYVQTYTCTDIHTDAQVYRVERKDSGLVSNFAADPRYQNRRLKCSARVLGLEEPRRKLSRCVFAPPYHVHAIDPVRLRVTLIYIPFV